MVCAGRCGRGSPSADAAAKRAGVGPGKIITARGGGEIYGFDVNQNGNDGVLATANEVVCSVYRVAEAVPTGRHFR
jgi:hypothetical protein